MVRECVKRAVLNETRLDYDEDNFSGRHYKNPQGEYIDDEGYFDDPNTNPKSEEGYDEVYPDTKEGDNEYSWDRFDSKAVAPGLDDYYKVGKGAIPREVDNALNMRNHRKNWSDKDIARGGRIRDRWVKGKIATENLEDYDF
jgi:hypothetical protein